MIGRYQMDVCIGYRVMDVCMYCYDTKFSRWGASMLFN